MSKEEEAQNDLDVDRLEGPVREGIQKGVKEVVNERGEEIEEITNERAEEMRQKASIPRSKTKQVKDIEEGRRVAVNVSLPQKLFDRIIDQADEEDIPRSELLCKAVRGYLAGATIEELEKQKIREQTLLDNLPVLEGLKANHYDGEYAFRGLGQNWKKLKPLHPHTLNEIKNTLSEREGWDGNDYDQFLVVAAGEEGIAPEELSAAIDKAIKEKTLLDELPRKKRAVQS